jgi:hypothetical protein
MNSSNRPWPPLIVAERVPHWVKWRDALVTLLMWGSVAILVDAEFELFFGDFLEWLGLGDFGSDADWLVYFELLMPFLLTAALLAGALVIFSLRTLRRRSRALLLPQPAALENADQARRDGIDEAALIAARDRRIVIVHIDVDGRPQLATPFVGDANIETPEHKAFVVDIEPIPGPVAR